VLEARRRRQKNLRQKMADWQVTFLFLHTILVAADSPRRITITTRSLDTHPDTQKTFFASRLSKTRQFG
jgi:hypothetical protein